MSIKLIATIVLVLIGGYFLLNRQPNPGVSTLSPRPTQTDIKSELTGTAKGVVIVQNPVPGATITSPLTISGFVYGNNGTITIRLKQKESGLYVTEDKVVKITGKSDKIDFAEAIQFGLPIEPQAGILEVIYKDDSGKGLYDKVEIEVEFPSDLGRGE